MPKSETLSKVLMDTNPDSMSAEIWNQLSWNEKQLWGVYWWNEKRIVYACCMICEFPLSHPADDCGACSSINAKKEMGS